MSKTSHTPNSKNKSVTSVQHDGKDTSLAQADKAENPQTLTSQNVVGWLLQNPSLLREHPELLEVLDIPHQSGRQATSLIERQVTHLREALQKQDQRLNGFLEIAHANEQLGQQLHDLTVSILNTQSFNDALNTLIIGLREDFNAEEIRIYLTLPSDASKPAPSLTQTNNTQSSNTQSNKTDQPQASKDSTGDDIVWLQPQDSLYNLASTAELFVGRATKETRKLFAGTVIGSMVYLPLQARLDQPEQTPADANTSSSMGLLAIGSANEDRFPPGTSTDLLKRLTELVTPHLIRLQTIKSA